MAAWKLLLFLAALAGTAVCSDNLAFPEDVRGGVRIVSGWEAEIGQIPHQLSLRMVSAAGAVSSCGGSIISEGWGLTAAHCTAGRVTMVIRAGTVNLTRPATIFETTKYYNHPEYNEALQSVVQPHDIGLLEFGRSIEFNEFIKPIRLQPSADMNHNYDGVRLVASGWGRTWTNGLSPENLNWVYLRGDSNLACWVAFGGSSIIVDSTICASGYNVTSQSTCQGDSGGPLVAEYHDGELTQVGVTSFVSGTGCHTPVPAGFVRPGHYHDWFYSVSGINFDWQPEREPEPEPEPEPEVTEEPEPETEVTEEPETPTEEPEVTTAEPEAPTEEPEVEPVNFVDN